MASKIEVIVSFSHDSQDDFDCSPEATGFPGLVSCVKEESEEADYKWRVIAEYKDLNEFWDAVESWQDKMVEDSPLRLTPVSVSPVRRF